MNSSEKSNVILRRPVSFPAECSSQNCQDLGWPPGIQATQELQASAKNAPAQDDINF